MINNCLSFKITVQLTVTTEIFCVINKTWVFLLLKVKLCPSKANLLKIALDLLTIPSFDFRDDR